MEEASWKIVYIVTYRLYFQTTYQVIAHRYSITVANISFRSVITLERRGKGGKKRPPLNPYDLLFHSRRSRLRPTRESIRRPFIFFSVPLEPAYSDLTNVECPAYRK